MVGIPRLSEGDTNTHRRRDELNTLRSDEQLPTRRVDRSVAALPLALGATVVATVWIALQVLVLALVLGSAVADRGDASGERRTYLVGSAVVAAAAFGLGAATCARLLVLRDVRRVDAGRTALLQSAVLAAVLLGHGAVAARPSGPSMGVLVAAVAVGTVLGVRIGAREART